MGLVDKSSLTAADATAALHALVETHGSQQAVAERLKISSQYVNDLLRGRRSFSDAMLAKLGMRRVVVKR